MLIVHRIAIFLYLFIIEQVICAQSNCSIADGSVGVCVQVNECPSVRALLENSIPPLPSHVPNILNGHTCGFDSDRGTPKVCCLDDNLPTEGTATPTPSTTLSHRIPSSSSTTRTTEPELNLNNRNDLPEDVSTHPNLNLLPLTSCGEIVEQKLSNGNITNLFEFPWMALLRYDNGIDIMNLCGGSLISARYVLTAAHCVPTLESTTLLVAVRLGEYDTTTDIDCQVIGQERICAPAAQDIPVEEAIRHPMYDSAKHSNDIAIIRLSSVADMTPESVRPICLPTTFRLQNTVLKRVAVTGWGLTETKRPATILLQAFMPVVPNDICQTKFYKQSTQLTASQICAGNKDGVSSCRGDSGGPLMFPAAVNRVRMVQFGIVSFGASQCSSYNFPGIYAKVAYYMRWILDEMRP